YGGSSKGKLDLYYNKKDTKNLKPIVIFVHGGGWISGDKYNFISIGTFLQQQGYVAALPNHVLFPEGKIDDMVNDIYQSVQWVYKNAYKYGGDNKKITFVGYSAGAHIMALTAIKASLKMTVNKKVLQPLPRAEKMVLFNSPYDFDDYDSISQFENGIIKRIVSFLVNSQDVGPTDVLKRLSDNSVTDFGFTKCNIFYAEKDNMIPVTTAPNLIKQLHRVSPNTIINEIYQPGFDHSTLLIGARDKNEEMQQMFLDIVEM
ncbi:hypothetical protein PIROE2DRAFT_17899, partial [Piromyces sp. E2]